MKKKTGVLLINLGTPNSSQTSDVRQYLRQFLMDRRVIDIPFWKRFLLINLIIAPFRSPKSAKEYQRLWTKEGSPLLTNSQNAAKALQKELGDDYFVVLGMRYQNPSIESVIHQLKKQDVERIIVLPLFPQYASSSTGSALEEVMRIVKKDLLIPNINFIDSYPSNSKMLDAYIDIANKHKKERNFDHILFSFHGLPERHLKKENTNCQMGTCCDSLQANNRLCYRAQCFETARNLIKKMQIPEGDYTISFQSRLGKTPWIKPYTDEVIVKLAQAGKKNILAFSPSFVADCLETTIEMGETYLELFQEHGGEHLQLVESLNEHPLWIEALKEMILSK
jgi:ferrochelatase